MQRDKLVILIVEDSLNDLYLIRRYLQQDPTVEYNIVETETGSDVATLCEEHNPDCILLDYSLPDTDGLEVFRELQRVCKDVPPVVLLTSHGDEALAVQAMKSGLSDYLSKSRMTPDLLRTALFEAITRRNDTVDTQLTSLQTASVIPRIVDERYLLESEGLRGGMGTVFEARDLKTEEKVALKLLRRPSDAIRHRFEREIRVLAKLQHPGIVRYLNHGTSGDGDLYLVMDWLDGLDLAGYLRCDRLSVEETVILGMRISEALEVAHSNRLIHRDIKPSNLFLVGNDVRRVTLIDFGIVHDSNSGTFLTSTGLTVGTPGYMAPEQILDDLDVDHRADIFSLGCVMYECLTGTHYFSGRNVVAVLAKLTDEEHDLRPRLYDIGLNTALADLLSEMLARRPEQRPEQADIVTRRLRALLASQ